jgi:hypothetical protein
MTSSPSVVRSARPEERVLAQPIDFIDDLLALVLPDRFEGLSKAELTAGAPRDRTGKEFFTREFAEPLVTLIGDTLSEDSQNPHNPSSSRPVHQNARQCDGRDDTPDHAPPEQFDPTRLPHLQFSLAAPSRVQPSSHTSNVLPLSGTRHWEDLERGKVKGVTAESGVRPGRTV